MNTSTCDLRPFPDLDIGEFLAVTIQLAVEFADVQTRLAVHELQVLFGGSAHLQRGGGGGGVRSGLGQRDHGHENTTNSVSAV